MEVLFWSTSCVWGAVMCAPGAGDVVDCAQSSKRHTSGMDCAPAGPDCCPHRDWGQVEGSWKRRLPRGALRSGVRIRPEEVGVPGRGKEHFILRQRVECGRAEAQKGCTGSCWESVNYKHPSLGKGEVGGKLKDSPRPCGANEGCEARR